MALSTETHVTVQVTNVNEPGVVTIDRIQPEVGTQLTASIDDEDIDDTVTVAWRWYVSTVTNPLANSERHWRMISDADNGDAATYTPSGTRVGNAANSTPDTAGKYLRAVATYTDSLGAERTPPGVTDNAVRAEVASSSDSGVTNPANGSPGFTQGADYSRTVSESLAKGMNVGAPVVARDPQNTVGDPNKDELTYELDDDTTAGDDVDTTTDVGYFSINRATGQLMVAKSLDYDGNTERKYEFYVRAYDPSGESGQVMVTVNVTDANDAPEIMGSVTDPANNTAPAAPSELRVNEQDSDEGAGPYDGMPGMLTAYILGSPNVFTAPDEDERGQITWTLEGEDKDQFALTQTNLGLTDEPVAVVFDSPPDYENPTDANGDSVYKVTLVATDSTSLVGSTPLRDERDLTVFVDNVHELGKVTMASSGSNAAQPHIGEAINAEVTDPDGGVAVVTWQWLRDGFDGDIDVGTFNLIPGATSSSYTPVDDDDGASLQVKATYIDMTSDMDDSATATVDERVQTTGPAAKTASDMDGSEANATTLYRVMATSENAVRVAPGDPTTTDDPAFEMASYDRTVAENAETGSLVGEPVTVTKEKDVTFKYDLVATVTTDNSYFTIDNYGQIRVGEVDFPSPLPPHLEAVPDGVTAPDNDDPALDYEGASKTFSLVVTATDMEKTSRTATARVTVTLDNLNEVPYFDKVSRADAGTEAIPITYIESRTNAVVELAAVEPDGNTLRWETVGADGPDFEIRPLSDLPGSGKDRVALHFRSQPDFESGKGSVEVGSPTLPNGYRVTVRAVEATAVGSGPNMAGELMVYVTVQNADEDGSVDISLLLPEVGTQFTATASDPDGGVTGDSWTWYRSKVSNPVQNETDITDSTFTSSWEAITGAATDGTYTPGTDDVGKYLLARAAYEDDQGTGKAAVARTAERVRADVADDDNNSPDFSDPTTTRTIEEDADVGDDVGNPVVVDVNEDNDVLTYALDDDGAEITDGSVNTTTIADDTDATYFSIDKGSGQISVAKKLDFDANPSTANPDGEYVVWVRVWDSSGQGAGENNDRIEVTITATNVNDAPKVTGGAAEISVNEVDSSKKPSDNGQYFIGLGNTAEEDTPFTVNKDANEDNLYRRTDEDQVESGRWPEPIGGPDGSHFEYSTPVDETEIGRRLHFKKSNLPDYENPMDVNRDNVYEVTIRVLDNDGEPGTKNVRITVMNVNEAGKLVLTPEQPDAGMPVVATLTDPDGVTSITNWKWAIADGTVANFDAAEGLTAPDGLVPGATTSQYMADEGKFVWAMVEYRDGASTVNHPVTALDERNDDPDTAANTEQHKLQDRNNDGTLDDSDNSFHNSDERLSKVADNAVEPDPDTTTGPEAPSADIIEVERMVYENVPSTGYVGIPLDPDKHIDYKSNGGTASRDTIAGPDAATFVFAEENDDNGDAFYDDTLAPSADDEEDKKGQLAAAVVTHFDHETTPSYIIEIRDPDAQVTVGAVRVTITVVDVNEAPSAPAQLRGTPGPRNNAPEFQDADGVAISTDTRSVPENTAAGENIGAPVMAMDADDDTLTYTLGGTDMASFDIDTTTGQLMTKAALDFETTPSYTVTVTADDGNGGTDTITVTITVTDVTTGNAAADIYDVDENGEIDSDEVLDAVEAYFDDDNLTPEQILDIVDLYFAS